MVRRGVGGFPGVVRGSSKQEHVLKFLLNRSEFCSDSAKR